MGILVLIAAFENDMAGTSDGWFAKGKDLGVKFGRKRELTDEKVEAAIMKRTGFSKASIYRALG